MATIEGTIRSIIFLEVESREQAFLMKSCPSQWQGRFYREEADRIAPEKISDAGILSVFIYSDLDAALLSRLPKLRMIATRSAGYDHILMGKTLGVIGTGQIGRHVIRIANGFQMRVLAYDAGPEPSLADLLGFQYADLNELLSRADVISLHCPLTPETRHLIGRDEFQRMKRGALLINTARGGLVDTEALLSALEAGIVGGAGLDVLEEEEAIREERELLSTRFDGERPRSVVRNHILLKRDDVIITPHIACNSREAVERILTATLDNIAGFLEGTPRNCVA